MIQAPAVVFESIGKVSVRDVIVSDPGPLEVQIKTECSVLSPGTEGWVLNNVFTWQPTVYPCIPGYQRVGIIHAIGCEVQGWAIGERVAATRANGSAEVGPMWGSHAAFANTSVEEIYRIPDGVSSLNAASSVVAQVGYNAASRATLNHGDWVVVYGDGIIGQSAAQSARALGAHVILVGHRDDRLALARTTGIPHVINRKQSSPVSSIREIVGAPTVTAVLDSIQGHGPQAEYVDLLEHGKGQIVYCGFSSVDSWASMALLQQRELTTHFISGWKRERIEKTLHLMSTGDLNLHGLVTHHVPYSQAPDMYRMINEKAQSFLGIALDWA